MTGKKRRRSATTIQVESSGGAILERTTQESVENTIFNEIHKKRFTLASQALICNGEIFSQFDFTANMPATKAVLDGTYSAPADSDRATRSYLRR